MFLANDDAEFITGVEFPFDGGRTVEGSVAFCVKRERAVLWHLGLGRPVDELAVRELRVA